MIVNYTAEEQAKWQALEDKYEKLINEINEQIRGNATAETYKEKEKEILKRRSLAEPLKLHPLPKEYDENNNPVYDEKELEQYYNSEEYKAYKKALEDTRKELTEFYRSFTPYSENEFTELKRKRAALIDEHARARQQLYEECELRQFNELGGDPVNIIEDAKSQVEQVINNRYIAAIKYKEEGAVFSERYLRVDGDKLLIDTDSMIEDCRSILSLHYEALKEDQAATEALIESISDVIINNPYTGDTGILGGFVNDHSKNKKPYRTVAKAKQKGAITEAPKSLIIPTLPNYQYSMSLHQEGGAYLQPLSSMDNLQFKEGKLYFSDARAREVSEVELRDLRTKEGIEDLDLSTLRFFYSILFDQFQRSNYKVLQDFIIVSAPLLAGRKDPTAQEVNSVIAKIQSYHNMMGVIKGNRNGKTTESYYQVLNFEYYDEQHNIIAFSSPYMNYVIQTIYDSAIRKDREGKPKLKHNGEPLTLPNHSYLIDESIIRERNRAAVENVILLVQGIEQAGGNGYKVRPQTLIDRNPQLAERLERDTSHKAQILKRAFVKTWELLREKTRLQEVYKDIQLPDPKDPKFIPTSKTLDEPIEITHKGKVK